MNYYFECTIKYDKTQENGLPKKVTEKYLVEAVSFTEAEARFIKEMASYISGEYDIVAIKRLQIAELFESQTQDADRYYKSKLTFICIDEQAGKEKKSTKTVFVHATDFDDARNTIQECMKGTLADWEKSSVQETTIMDVFKYEVEPGNQNS